MFSLFLYATKCIELLLTFANDLECGYNPQKTSKPTASPITNSVRIAGTCGSKRVKKRICVQIFRLPPTVRIVPITDKLLMTLVMLVTNTFPSLLVNCLHCY
jgi:hypothetical protein